VGHRFVEGDGLGRQKGWGERWVREGEGFGRVRVSAWKYIAAGDALVKSGEGDGLREGDRFEERDESGGISYVFGETDGLGEGDGLEPGNGLGAGDVLGDGDKWEGSGLGRQNGWRRKCV